MPIRNVSWRITGTPASVSELATVRPVCDCPSAEQQHSLRQRISVPQRGQESDVRRFRRCPFTVDQIDLWRQSPSEHQRLEFKEAKTQVDGHKLCEYCVALANEGGGYLLLGVEDKSPRAVVGSSACSNTVGMARQLFEWLGFRVDVEAVAHPDGRVVVFHIPSRPRGTA